ncbi:MAG TPA: hypothetical protein DD658_01760 [Deltaproteobacteria bacterium]|nr:MAG: hypothetical protein A2X88_05720 [Deltaproteobacteria bacterium GWC2_65_14]HBO68923.1 hypothetical protein [Deltaproteobacteria bacterium]
MTGEVPPDEPIRFLLGESGWEVDSRYSADGPGTTSFALRKNGILCLFTGGAHSWTEDGNVCTRSIPEGRARRRNGTLRIAHIILSPGIPPGKLAGPTDDRKKS